MPKRFVYILILILTVSLLALLSCDEDNSVTNVVAPDPPPPGTQPITAGFTGNVTPVAASDDGFCRLILTSTTTGGDTTVDTTAPPYTYLWSLESLAASANTRQGYPNERTVVLTFPPTFGAAGGSTHLIELTTTDQRGTMDKAAASEPVVCTGATVVGFTGGLIVPPAR